MRLHGDMRIQMIQSPIRLFTSLMSTFVHALNLLVATAGTLVLLGTGNWDERVDLWLPFGGFRQRDKSHKLGEKACSKARDDAKAGSKRLT